MKGEDFFKEFHVFHPFIQLFRKRRLYVDNAVLLTGINKAKRTAVCGHLVADNAAQMQEVFTAPVNEVLGGQGTALIVIAQNGGSSRIKGAFYSDKRTAQVIKGSHMAQPAAHDDTRHAVLLALLNQPFFRLHLAVGKEEQNLVAIRGS